MIGAPVERRVFVRNKSHPGFEQVLDERILGENETRTISIAHFPLWWPTHPRGENRVGGEG